MRENKFRAWDKKSKTWIVLSMTRIYKDPSKNQSPIPEMKIRFSKEYDEKDIVIVQFTGLKDRNGTEIYEGDIVKYNNLKLVVEYYKGRFFARLIGGTKSEGYWNFGINSKEYEIIGTIFENEELLK